MEYKFVDSTSTVDKYICNTCMLVSCDPQQASCCGNVYCKSCLQQLKDIGQNFNCPTCRHDLTNNYFPDRKADLEIKSLQVYCRNDHCLWIGKIEDIDNHLQQCLYQTLSCTYGCGENIQRKQLQHHLENECFVKCQSAHKGTCPKEIISCEYSTIGCTCMKRMSKREEQEKHNEQSAKQHLMMAILKIAVLKRFKHANDKTIAQLKISLSQAKGLELTDFSKRKSNDELFHTPGFYTSSGGYKMSLCIYTNGIDEAKGTHVSCFICLMSGEYDDILEWPFQGEVTIELLNQLEDNNHHKYHHNIEFNESTPQECNERVVGKLYGTGRGLHQFISHSQLGYNCFLNCQYLKNDALYFTISVKVTSTTI